MKRAVSAAAILVALLASPCPAAKETRDIVIITPTPDVSGGNALLYGQTPVTFKNKLRWLLDILDEAGADYALVPSNQTKTEHVRRGTLLFAGGDTLVARSYIFPSFWPATNYSSRGNVAGRLRSDSLSLVSGGGIDVPSLFLIDNASEYIAGGNINPATDYLDSTGTSKRFLSGAQGDFIPGSGMFIRSKALPTLPFLGTGYFGMVERRTDPTTVPGGVRPLLCTYSSYLGYYNFIKRNSAHWDSCAYSGDGLGVDSMLVWDRLWAGIASAKPMTFCRIGGVGYNDSANTTAGIALVKLNTDTEGDVATLMYGLAHFDSLCGSLTGGRGPVFKRLRSPFRLATIVYALCNRNLRRINRGIQWSDTTTAYATMDSLRDLTIPVTYVVDVDSMAAYPRDVVKAMENPLARFTPATWYGVDDSVAANTSATRPVDVWGRFRTRTFRGDSSFTGADSSLWAQLKWQRDLLAAVVGATRLSKCAVAPLDDYSPAQMSIERGGNLGAMADSIVWAASKAGYTHLLSNVRYRTGDPSYHPAGALPLTNPRGWFMRQEAVYSRATGKPFFILGHNEQPMRQGDRHAVWFSDSSITGNFVGSLGLPQPLHGMLQRGPLNDTDAHQPPGDTWWTVQVDANFYDYKDINIDVEEWNTAIQHGNGHALSFASLSGDPLNPARSGYWNLKSIRNLFENVNLAAGRPIMVLSYPEDITR